MSAFQKKPKSGVLGAELETATVHLSCDQAEQIACHHYGLAGHATWLWGEKDSNFRLTLEDGTAYLLKILNPAENPLVTSMHSLALLHVEEVDPGIPTQRVILTRNGAADFRFVADDGTERGVRMVTFAPGVAQRTAPQSPLQRRRVGAMLGRLQKALKSFSHEAALHRITWDLKHAAGMREVLPTFCDVHQRTRLENAINEFEEAIVPVMNTLDAQVIHNDFNMENILVDTTTPDTITGIIDFGDMVHAPTLFDVGVAAAYQIGDESDPIGAMCDLISGYRSECSLSDGEIPLIYKAADMRLVMRLCITRWRARLFPEHAERLTTQNAGVWAQLARLDAIPRTVAIERLREAIR
ncbi:phosphotransferase (plasmid) [Rhizobium sp. Pop5]|uniref:phosphotransferase n=1 Tax=Rhizobium sp. Pop5 TaxID=1223565 RepID=UPI000283BBA0|nr:phosphotransferase [Rhizobium sp. Pop5]EJZ18523.1 aminotransferase [Rhizobium sp. Pop5]UVD60870.1 phosphotransferase [Rhizobium sp. Pop5]